MSRILLAIGDRDLRGQVAEELKNAPELESQQFVRVSEFATALDAIEDSDDVSLIVMDYDLAYERGDSSSDIINQPVKLATDLAANAKAPGILVLGPITRSEDIQRISLLDKTETIDSQQIFDPDIDRQRPFIVSKIISMLDDDLEDPVDPEPSKGLIELVIDSHDMVHCTTGLFTDGYYTQCSNNRDFKYDSSIKRMLEVLTQNLSHQQDANDSDDTFINTYKLVGEKTRDILNHNDDAKLAIRDLIHKAHGVDNIWIRFRVPYRNMPNIPFEAILQCDRLDDQEARSNFQLIHSPVYRVVGDPGSPGTKLRAPILSGLRKNAPKKISCLVIDALTSGSVDTSIDSELPDSLDEIEDSGLSEIETVSSLFSEMSDKGVVVKFDSVTFETDQEKENPAAVLAAKFKSRDWDIVHFSGHSFFKEGDENNADKPDQGYIFLPGKLFAVPVSIKQVADWFGGASLVYMSSCQSAEPGFVSALAERGIPTMIGFRWNVSSVGAAQFASLFYYNLFHGAKTGDIEPSFVEAQRSLMDPVNYPLPRSLVEETIWTHPDKRAWASPMLVMQNV